MHWRCLKSGAAHLSLHLGETVTWRAVGFIFLLFPLPTSATISVNQLLGYHCCHSSSLPCICLACPYTPSQPPNDTLVTCPLELLASSRTAKSLQSLGAYPHVLRPMVQKAIHFRHCRVHLDSATLKWNSNIEYNVVKCT